MAVTLNASTSSGLVQTADTSGTIELQSNGTTKLTVSSSGAYGQLISGTAVASTSGTSIDFTSIPSWVKRITVMFDGVSTNGGARKLIQIGAGSFSTSGYVSSSSLIQGSSAATASSTGGFIILQDLAPDLIYGTVVITNFNANTWIATHTVYSDSTTDYNVFGAGSIALGGTLDRVRITTVNGTDTFDAGSINIQYEG